MTIEPASRFTHAELAEVFTRGYEGYAVPVTLDAAAFEAIVGYWSIDLERSAVALGDDRRLLGVANLGVRGDRGWIGGIGVAKEARGRGIGRALMETVLAAAPPTVWLEVIEGNDPARNLYLDLGFEDVRVLEVWSLTAEVPAADVRDVEPRPIEMDGLPWQREAPALPAGYERIEVDGGALVFRVAGGQVNVAQLDARDEEVASQLLRAARGRGHKLLFVNVPEGDPASAALRALGGSLDLRQFEMRLLR